MIQYTLHLVRYQAAEVFRWTAQQARLGLLPMLQHQPPVYRAPLVYLLSCPLTKLFKHLCNSSSYVSPPAVGLSSHVTVRSSLVVPAIRESLVKKVHTAVRWERQLWNIKEETIHRLHARNLVVKGVSPMISTIPSPVSTNCPLSFQAINVQCLYHFNDNPQLHSSDKMILLDTIPWPLACQLLLLIIQFIKWVVASFFHHLTHSHPISRWFY